MYSCEKKKTQDEKVIHFDLEQEVLNKHTTSLIKDCKIIPLETNDSVLIGSIDKVIVDQDKLYVGDFSKTHSVYVFDLQGNFQQKISRQGRGPEEYLSLYDMFIDPHTGELNLLSRIDRKLLAFDKNDVSYRKTQKLPKTFMELIPSQNGYAGFSANYSEDRNDPYNLWLLDKDFQIYNKEFSIQPTWESRWSSSVTVFSSFQDTVYYIPAIRDFSVYKLDGDRFTLEYSINFGKSQIPASNMSYDEYLEYSRKHPEYVTRLDCFQETDRFLVCQFLFNGQQLLGLYDKIDKKTVVCSLSPYVGKYFTSFGNIVNFSSDYLITTVSASNICEKLTGKNQYVNFEEDYPEQIKRMREEFSGMGIKEDSNPCVVIYSF